MEWPCYDGLVNLAIEMEFILWQVLVVQEISGKFKGTGVWKFPAGVVNEVSMPQVQSLIKFFRKCSPLIEIFHT